MRKIFLSAFIMAAATSMACTNFIVGKKASVDGSVMMNADRKIFLIVRNII